MIATLDPQARAAGLTPDAGRPAALSHADLVALERRHGANNYKPLDVVLTEGKGVWVWDVEGRRYLDCLSAYSAVNQGHCHPRILAAMTAQAARLTLTSRAFHNDQLGPFYAELCALTGYERALPMNSGAEAVESALKLVRKWGYEVKGVAEDRAHVIVADGNFHGRTTAIVGFSTDEGSRHHFGPFAPGFTVVPYGDAKALAAAITADTVAVLLEPIQGEAGVVIPPEGYLRAVRAACDRARVLLVLDEIQTGLGRTGTLFAQEHEGVRADVVTIGKALSGGFYPVSAVLATAEVMAVLHPGQHGSTFGGNPLACAVARAALRVLVDEGLIENAARVGARLADGLRAIAARPGSPIREIRARGLMIGVELDHALGGARPYCEALRARGILCKETHTHTIRIAPPLVLTADDADWALERFAAVLGG